MIREKDLLSQLTENQQGTEATNPQITLYMQQEALEDYMGFPHGTLSEGLIDKDEEGKYKRPKLPFVVINGVKYLNRLRIEELYDRKSRRIDDGSDRLPDVMPQYGSISMASGYTGLPESWLREKNKDKENPLPGMKFGNKTYINLPLLIAQLADACTGAGVNGN